MTRRKRFEAEHLVLEDINGEIRELGFGRHKLSLTSTSPGGLSEISNPVRGFHPWADDSISSEA